MGWLIACPGTISRREQSSGLGTNNGLCGRKRKVTTIEGLKDASPVVQEGFGGIATPVEVICKFGHEALFNEVTENATHHFFKRSLAPRHSHS